MANHRLGVKEQLTWHVPPASLPSQAGYLGLQEPDLTSIIRQQRVSAVTGRNMDLLSKEGQHTSKHSASRYHPRMNLAAPAPTGGPASWITILVAVIAAVAAITAAIVAALSAQSTKRLEVQSQRARELEGRISEKKFDTYRPMIELLGSVIGSSTSGVQMDSAQTQARIAEFSTWITIYGSDSAVKTYHNFMQAAFNNAPALVASRLYVDFIIAARRDIGYPETSVTTLQVMGIRINDIYSETNYRLAMSLPFEELCQREKWVPPWLTPIAPGTDVSTDRSPPSS